MSEPIALLELLVHNSTHHLNSLLRCYKTLKYKLGNWLLNCKIYYFSIVIGLGGLHC